MLRSAFALLLGLTVGSGVAVTVAPSAYATGSAYYVDGASPTCSDLGAGSQAAPFCTITQGAKKAILPGDVVHVAPAAYREQVTVGGSGTTADPISFVADAPGAIVVGTRALGNGLAVWSPTGTAAFSTPYAPPSAPRQVFVDGERLASATSASTTTANTWFYDGTAKVLYLDLGGADPTTGHEIEAGAQTYGFALSSRHDVIVRGFETRRQNIAGVRMLSSSAVLVDQVTAVSGGTNGLLVESSGPGVTLSADEVTRAVSTGIRLAGSNGITVRGSSSHHNGLHGIGLSTTTASDLDGNSVFANTAPGALTANGIDVNTSSPDNVIRNNIAHDNEDSGIQVYSSSHRALVVRNLSYANGDHGFDALSSTGVRFVNNTAHANRRDGISVEGGSTGATVTNNVLVNNGEATNEYDLYVDPPSVAGFSSDYNVLYNDDLTPQAKYNGVVYKKLAAYTAATGQDAHGLMIDPGFIAPAAGDFRLTPGTSAVDSADASTSGFASADGVGNPPVDDPIVPDRGAGTPSYADRGALEQQPPAEADHAPYAAIVLDPPAAAVPPSTPVTADASGSSDADTAGIASYTFDFGDGTVVGPQPGPTATHAFAGPGTYPVQVTVRDSAGASRSATATEVVTLRPLQTYQVAQQDPACLDTGAGTTAQPFCTIGAATKKALAGDTVLVAAGTYREQVTPTARGESANHITLRATGPNVVISGSNDLSSAAWEATGTTAWRVAYAPAAAPTQVWADQARLALASSATTTTSGSWFYDPVAKYLYVDLGGGNPGAGHAIAAGARNFGLLLRNVSWWDVSGFRVVDTNLSGVFLDSTDQVTLAGVDAVRAGAHGVTIDNSARANLSGILATDNLSIGVRFFRSSDSTLADSQTHHNQLHGVSVQQGTNVTVKGVVTHDNLKPGSRVAAGIDVSAGSVGTVVSGNTSYDNDDSGVGVNSASSGTVVRRNLLYGNGDHGVDSSNAQGSVVASNTVVQNATAGINFEGGSTNGTTRDNVTLDNAVGSTRTIGEIRVDESSATGISLNRDLVFQTAAGGPLFEWASQPYAAIAAFRTASAQEPNGLAADPRFRSVATRDWRLTTTSPAIDAAYTGFAAWQQLDLTGAAPVDLPTVNTGNGPDPYADLGALEYTGPVAVLTATPTTGFAPLNVAVDARASTSVGSPITTWLISCGNATTVNASSGTCRYPAAGTYTVTATVTAANGQQDSATRTITVQDTPPTAQLTFSPAKPRPLQAVTLSGAGSTDPDSTPVSAYRFDCGFGFQGNWQTSPTYSCSYLLPGTYTAKLTVRDTAGLTGSTTAKVAVK
jgi:parallel beta-helix repeat protein